MNIFGVDLGMGANKIWGPAGGLQLPSHVALDGQSVGHLAGMETKQPPLKVTVDGRSYYVGAGAHDWGRPIENLDYDRLNGSPEMLAVFYGAFTHYQEQYGPIERPLHLIVGLPLEPLSDPANAQANLDAVRGWLAKTHNWQVGHTAYTLPVADVRITSQPTGAFFDHLLDDNGRPQAGRGNLKEKEVGIIAVGFNTVELLVVQNYAPVQRFTDGATSGVRRLLELVNGSGLYSLGELDGRLRAGALNVDEALPVWAREVHGFVERTWGKSWRRFGQIVIAGGGAVLLGDHLTGKFNGKAVLLDEPVLGIAHGLYKMGKLPRKR